MKHKAETETELITNLDDNSKLILEHYQNHKDSDLINEILNKCGQMVELIEQLDAENIPPFRALINDYFATCSVPGVEFIRVNECTTILNYQNLYRAKKLCPNCQNCKDN